YDTQRLVHTTADAVRRLRTLQAARLAVQAVVDALRLEPIADHTGVVARLARDWATITFETASGPLERDFPTWRLRRTGADELGAKVQHFLGAIADLVVSRLRLLALPEKGVPRQTPSPVVLSDQDYDLLEHDTPDQGFDPW
ncbi:MAG: hypothetical protein AAB403_18190, partial [Planctomycetota bacterium]